MVPRLLHRIWLDDPVPDEVAAYGRDWARLHPEWRIREWRDSAGLPPLRNRDLFDNARQIAPKDWKRFQADLLRLELLWLYGGVYADCDVQPLRAFDPLLSNRRAIVAYSPNRFRGKKILTQAVLASVPAHEWIDACIAGMPGSVCRYRGKPLAQMAGPHHVHRVWKQYHHGVTVLPSWYFYPQSNRDRDAGRPVHLGDAYAWHKWANTRDNRRGGV